jgi:hypothetical protein
VVEEFPREVEVTGSNHIGHLLQKMTKNVNGGLVYLYYT